MTLKELLVFCEGELLRGRADNTQIGYLLDESDAGGATGIERERPIVGFVWQNGRLLGRS